MVNNDISDDGLGVQGSLSAEFTQGSSLPNEPLAADSNSYSPTPVSNTNTEVDENTRLTPTSLYCSVPLNKDVQSIIESFSKTETENVAKKIRKIPCLYCDRTFVAESLRQKHVERIHSVKQARRSSSRLQQPFSGSISCLYCEKFTLNENRLDDLFVHLVTVHQEKYFGCLVCKERFILPSQLQEHNESSHGIKYKNDVQWLDDASDKSSAINEHDMLKTKHKAKTKKEISSDMVTKANLRRSKHVSQKVLRSKRIALKSTKLGIKRNTRLQTKLTSGKIDKRRPKQKEQEKLEKDQESMPDSDNPYPTFDAFYRVKKITDHSIDNIRISSLTFNDVFDQAFFTRINCNIRENLLNHLDGKLFKNEESENRISNFEKTQTDYTNTENFGCVLSLNAATPIATNVLTAQFGDDPETQIEYGSKASKKKTPPKQDQVHYKYFTRRKYQASILESKENRDLSKLDMWTQFVIKTRQQKIEASQKTDKERVEYKKRGEYRAKLSNDELNRILDRRGPFEDLKEEANIKAALECNFNQEANADVACILDEVLDNVFSITAAKEVKTELPDSEIPAYLNLIKAPLNNETYVDKSDRITLICSSQETENFEAPQVVPKDKNATVELTGEWARSRLYICAACGLKLANMKLLMDHKNIVHQNVWCQHYEFVGKQGEFYKHLSIPGLGKMNYVEENLGYKTWKRSDARLCTKCQKQCNSLGELHRHILECGEDWTWMLVRKKCKYRPFGSKTRKKRRGLFKRIIQKEKLPDENRVKRKYKKRFEGPRPKPSDAETIERMLANLPAKRATRKMVCLKDGLTRRKKNNVQSTNSAPVQQTATKIKNMRIRRNRAELLLQESNSILKGKIVKSISTKCNPVLQNIRKSVRNLNKVISSKVIDSNNTLVVKRKLMNAYQQQQRITRRTQDSPQEDEVIESIDQLPENDPPVEVVVETNKKINIIKKIKNAFKNTADKIETNDINLETTDTKLEVDTPQPTNNPDKKKISKKKNFASKLIRTLSIRKKKEEPVESLLQESPEEVQKFSIDEDSENTKNNGKRKSRLESVKSVVKKIKTTRKTKKDNKLIHNDDSVVVGGHFLEEGSNTLSAETVVIELSPTEEVDPDKECNNPDIVKDEIENVVESVEPPASENIESISEGLSEDIKQSDHNEKQNVQKPKLCKRSKGLNACIAMLTNKLLQKDDPIDLSKIEDKKDDKVSLEVIKEEEIGMNIDNYPIDLSKNKTAPLIVPNSKALLPSSIMEQEHILEHKSIEPISSQANLPLSEDMHVEKVENIIKLFTEIKSVDYDNGINKLRNGFVPIIQSSDLNTNISSETNLAEVLICNDDNSKVLPRKIGQRRAIPKKRGRKPKVCNSEVSNIVTNGDTLDNTSPILNGFKPNLAPTVLLENCKIEFHQNKKLLKNDETLSAIIKVPVLNSTTIPIDLNYSNKTIESDVREETNTRNIVKTPGKRGRKKKITIEPVKPSLPSISEELESETNRSSENLSFKPETKRKTRNSVQNILINQVNPLPTLDANASVNVQKSIEKTEIQSDLIVNSTNEELNPKLNNLAHKIDNIVESLRSPNIENKTIESNFTETLTSPLVSSEQLEESNVKKSEPFVDFKNFGKEHPMTNHSINNILESVGLVQPMEFNLCKELSEVNIDKQDVTSHTPKGRRRRRRNEKRNIANKNKNVEIIINDFADNIGCSEFSKSMLDGDLNLVDDSSKENFGGVIKSDLNIVSNQINEVNSKSPNNKEILENNIKLDTKHNVCKDVTIDSPNVNSEATVENSKSPNNKFRINNEKIKTDTSNNCCQEEKNLYLPILPELIKTPKTDHFIGNILRAPKLNLYDHFKSKPLMTQNNEDAKILIPDKLDIIPTNNDNVLFSKSTKVSNIFKINESFNSLNPFKNDLTGKANNLLKTNHENIYNFEEETEPVPSTLEKLTNNSSKCSTQTSIFAKDGDLNCTYNIPFGNEKESSLKSIDTSTMLLDVTDSEDELPLSLIKSNIIVRKSIVIEISPTLISNVDLDNNIPLGDVAPTFDNSTISIPRGDSIASSTDEINHSQSEDAMFCSKSSHEDLIIRLKPKNKKKRGNKKCNEYILDNSKYEPKSNHEILDTIFNEIVNEMKDVGHRHRKKSKKKKNSNKERRVDKSAIDKTEYLDSLHNLSDLSRNEPDLLKNCVDDVNENSIVDKQNDLVSLVDTKIEVNTSLDESNNEEGKSLVEPKPSKRKRGRPKVIKPVITEKIVSEVVTIEDLLDNSLKDQTSVYEFTENENKSNVLIKNFDDEIPVRKTRRRIKKIVNIPDTSILETENDDSFNSFEKSIVSETNQLEIEIDYTPLKNDKILEDNNESYLQTPDLNNSGITKIIQTKLKLKQGKKKKDMKIENDGVDNYCEICDKRFIRIDSLSKHKRTLTHIAKLSEIEAREAAEKAKRIEEDKEFSDDCDYTFQSTADENEVVQDEKIIDANVPVKDLSTLCKEIEADVMLKVPISIPDLPNNIILASPFSLTTNTDSLKLANIISDVIPIAIDINHKPFSTLNNNPCEARRYKSLGERKSFDSETVGYNSQSSFSNHKISTTTDSFLDKQILILENIIEENKASLEYIDEISVASNKSDDRCPSDMSLVSDIKPDDSNIISSFSHSTDTVNGIIHTESNFVKPTQYEEISEDSANTRNFDDHGTRKVLNRDEELFLECCSLLKSSSEVSNYSKKSTSRTISMVNSYSLKPEEEPEWLERKSFLPKTNPYLEENTYISDDTCPPTPIGENFDDYSNSNTSKTQWNTNVQGKEFDDISSDDDNGNDADFNYYDIDDKNDDNVTIVRLNKDICSKSSNVSNEESSTGFDFRKNVDSKFKDIEAEALKYKVSSQKIKNSKKSKPGEPTQTSITDYVVPLPKRSHSSNSSYSSETKKILTKGAMKIFEGLKVSIPTEDLDMKEVLNCSPTSKRLELEHEILLTKENTNNKVAQKPKVNLKKIGNNLGLKVTKKRVKPKKTHQLKIKKSIITDKSTPLDIYDFEETQDNTDLFIPNILNTFRTKTTEKTKPIKEFPNLEGIESDSESNNHFIDSFSVGTQSSFSTETESLNSSKRDSCVNNVTKKKCVIMGRIFKNAIKPKEDIKDVPIIDPVKLVENYVSTSENLTDDKKSSRKMSEKEMDILFDKLLEESKNERNVKSDEIGNKEALEEEIEPSLKHLKNKNIKHKKRVRKTSKSSGDEFNVSKAHKRRAIKKKSKERDDGINMEQELKECMGVAGRKSQRKCTSGKQNVLIEYWSSDDSDFEALLQQTLQPPNKPTEAPKIKQRKVIEEPRVVDISGDEPVVKVDLKRNEGIIEEEKIPSISPEVLSEIVRDVKESKKKVRRKSSSKNRDDSGVKLKVSMEETLASNRRKRSAADTLYYWSSSSDDDSQNLIEVKSVRDEIEEDDRPMQHGWIVGDSPKKLVTMLAQAKGKKLDTKCVKEQGKKRTTL